MVGERMYPILPVPDLDEALTFYGALGFSVTYCQQRPNPYAVVALEDLQVHLSGIDGFDPSASVSSVIITVGDAGDYRDRFAAGLRSALGRVPEAGIPRLLRVRRKAGTATGFSVVDTGGNWLRFYRADTPEETKETRRAGLGRVVDVAARQADARGRDSEAVTLLDNGIERYPDADPTEVVEALCYRAELLCRLHRPDAARADLERAASLVSEGVPGEAALLADLRDALEDGHTDPEAPPGS